MWLLLTLVVEYIYHYTKIIRTYISMISIHNIVFIHILLTLTCITNFLNEKILHGYN